MQRLNELLQERSKERYLKAVNKAHNISINSEGKDYQLIEIQLTEDEMKFVKETSKNKSRLSQIGEVIGKTAEEVKAILDPVAEAASWHSIPLNVWTFFLAFEETESQALLGVLSAGYAMGAIGLMNGMAKKAGVHKWERNREDFKIFFESTNTFMYAFRFSFAFWAWVASKWGQNNGAIIESDEGLVAPPVVASTIVAVPALILELRKNHSYGRGPKERKAAAFFDYLITATLMREIFYISVMESGKKWFPHVLEEHPYDFVLATYPAAIVGALPLEYIKHRLEKSEKSWAKTALKVSETIADYISGVIVFYFVSQLHEMYKQESGKENEPVFPILYLIGAAYLLTARLMYHTNNHMTATKSGEKQPLLSNTEELKSWTAIVKEMDDLSGIEIQDEPDQENRDKKEEKDLIEFADDEIHVEETHKGKVSDPRESEEEIPVVEEPLKQKIKPKVSNVDVKEWEKQNEFANQKFDVERAQRAADKLQQKIDTNEAKIDKHVKGEEAAKDVMEYVISKGELILEVEQGRKTNAELSQQIELGQKALELKGKIEDVENRVTTIEKVVKAEKRIAELEDRLTQVEGKLKENKTFFFQGKPVDLAQQDLQTVVSKKNDLKSSV